MCILVSREETEKFRRQFSMIPGGEVEVYKVLQVTKEHTLNSVYYSAYEWHPGDSANYRKYWNHSGFFDGFLPLTIGPTVFHTYTTSLAAFRALGAADASFRIVEFTANTSWFVAASVATDRFDLQSLVFYKLHLSQEAYNKALSIPNPDSSTIPAT